MTMVRIRGLHKSFGSLHVLRGVDLDVNRGDVLCIIGPSGSGKSTLLRCTNLLIYPDQGDIFIEDVKVNSREVRPEWVRQQIGMVFQQFNLFTHLTALQNVTEAPRRVLGLDAAAAEARGRALLARVGLAEHAGAYPQTLSGGQQQRVAIARALAMEPVVMLFDEPTSALDPRLVGEVLAVVGDLAAAGQTMVIVTHEIAFARRVANRVAVLVAGRIVESGTAEEVLERPKAAETRALLGR